MTKEEYEATQVRLRKGAEIQQKIEALSYVRRTIQETRNLHLFNVRNGSIAACYVVPNRPEPTPELDIPYNLSAEIFEEAKGKLLAYYDGRINLLMEEFAKL